MRHFPMSGSTQPYTLKLMISISQNNCKYLLKIDPAPYKKTVKLTDIYYYGEIAGVELSGNPLNLKL